MRRRNHRLWSNGGLFSLFFRFLGSLFRGFLCVVYGFFLLRVDCYSFPCAENLTRENFVADLSLNLFCIVRIILEEVDCVLFTLTDFFVSTGIPCTALVDDSVLDG